MELLVVRLLVPLVVVLLRLLVLPNSVLVLVSRYLSSATRMILLLVFCKSMGLLITTQSPLNGFNKFPYLHFVHFFYLLYSMHKSLTEFEFMMIVLLSILAIAFGYPIGNLGEGIYVGFRSKGLREDEFKLLIRSNTFWFYGNNFLSSTYKLMLGRLSDRFRSWDLSGWE